MFALSSERVVHGLGGECVVAASTCGHMCVRPHVLVAACFYRLIRLLTYIDHTPNTSSNTCAGQAPPMDMDPHYLCLRNQRPSRPYDFIGFGFITVTNPMNLYVLMTSMAPRPINPWASMGVYFADTGNSHQDHPPTLYIAT